MSAIAPDGSNARAFTVGNHIAFGPGEYDPGSPEGQHLIAHEVVHTLQQPDAPISMMPQEGGLQIDPDPQLEREADEAAEQVVAGDEPLVVNRMGTEMNIQRLPSKQSTLDGFDEDGFDDEFVEEADESETINLWSVLKAAAAGGSLTAAAQVLVQAGLLETGMQDPQTAGAAVGLSTAAYGLMQGYQKLYKEVDPQLLRTAFRKSGREELLDELLSMLGADVSDHSDIEGVASERGD